MADDLSHLCTQETVLEVPRDKATPPKSTEKYVELDVEVMIMIGLVIKYAICGPVISGNTDPGCAPTTGRAENAARPVRRDNRWRIASLCAL